MFSLRMIEGASLDEHIDEFNKVCDELETIDEGPSDESKALLLIGSLPKSYEHFVDALFYERQTLSLEKVKSDLGTKKLKDKQDNPESESSEGLMARGRPEKRENRGKKQGRSKSKQKHLKCFHCHKEGHFKRVFSERKNKNKETKKKTGNAAIATEEASFETAGVLIASNQKPQGIKENGLYVLDGHTAVGEANVIDNGGNRSMLWHLRMGHMSERDMRELQKQGVFGKDHIGALGFCEDFILGKSSRLRFETAAHTTKEKLGYIHSDLWGPAQVTLLGGCKYFLTFIDDFSRMIWVFALKSKDEVLERFKRWKIFIENQTGLKVKTLRIDNGLEYCNKLFEDFCEKNEIQRHKTVTYTPQQNGLAKRMNRTLVEKGKLEPRALKYRFLGYPEGVKGYRLWCVDSNAPPCIISRDVTFHEDEILNRPRSHVNNSESGVESDKVKFQVEPHNLKELEPEIEGAEIEPEVGVEHESTESEGDTYQLARDKKRRTIRPPKRYAVADLISYALTAAQELNDDEPRTYQEAITCKNKLEWKRAMDEEMASLMKNKTWELIEKPAKRKTISLRHASIRIILALVAIQDMHLEQMDEKIAFIHGELQEEIVMQQLVGNKSNKILFLTQKSYIKKVMMRFGMNDAKQVQTPLANHFKLSAAQCPQTDAEQQKMACIPYSSVVGSLMYAMVLTRPDISHAVSLVSRFMANPGYEHWRVVQWIMRYLKGTLEVGLVYGGEDKNGHTLIGYVDADFGGDLDKRRSQTGYLFTLGGCIVSWKATLQNVVVLSTTEAEYTAAVEAFKEAIWLKGMTTKLGAKQETVTIYSDSQSAIHLSKNQSHHEKTKHIDVKLHFVRLEVSRGAVKLLKIHTEENPANMLTKVVPTAKFILCMNLAGICKF
ncbi:Integrase catalytic domain-containing protein [Citrus sinensis]|uniref:Integrase catalytic domain-containing protein n=1 Tax=Citrus sinensis TaxID=2711 RepID=A0ACB8K909_CITSI|nr:Integrase catalytic domain-containing protein [Citrus sinensis]